MKKHPFLNQRVLAKHQRVYSCDEQYKVLLGKRIDHHWYGNLGGTSDQEDLTLLDTACREVREESMGEYVLTSKDLKNTPLHDLIRDSQGPDHRHRMYLKKVHYIDPNTLKTKLDVQTDHSKKEYTDFKWVSLKNLYDYIKEWENAINTTNKKQYALDSIFIHHPLVDMLRQKPVLEWIKNLSERKPVKETHSQGSLCSQMFPPHVFFTITSFQSKNTRY